MHFLSCPNLITKPKRVICDEIATSVPKALLKLVLFIMTTPVNSP